MCPIHTELAQSAAPLQARPSAHRLHDPPQSIADSEPFLTPSEQVGTWQTCPAHTELAQSEASLHESQSVHGSHEPPQSIAVSNPFSIPSEQIGAWQT